MTRQEAERACDAYNNRVPHPDPGWHLVVVESPRTLLGEPPFGGFYLRRERTKA